ncbi:MAG: hypothetical protein IJK18_04195 [Clostridia bacterium]|nr:hypothetical protein [Clostridia bacterium]
MRRSSNEIRRLKKVNTVYTIITLLLFGLNFVVIVVICILLKMKTEEFDFIMKIGVGDLVLNIIFIIFNFIHYLTYHIEIDNTIKINIIINILFVFYMLAFGNSISFWICGCIISCMMTESYNVMNLYFSTPDL